MTVRQAVVCTLVSCFVALVGIARGEPARNIAKNSFPSVVMLSMADTNQQPLCIGSGFFVDKGIIATNMHVIDGAGSGKAKIIGEKGIIAIKGTVGTDPRHDLALLAVDNEVASPLPLGDGAELTIGDTVYAVGNPKGLEGTFSQGIVSGVREVGSDRLLQLTAPISPGSSGGPVLNDRGQVLGVAVATLRGGQNLNFAIPVKDLQAIIKTRTEVKPLEGSKRKEPAKSVLSDFGGQDIRDAVAVYAAKWDNRFKSDEWFGATVKNRLQVPIRGVRLLAIAYDSAGEPVDSTEILVNEEVSPGMAKRFRHFFTSGVHELARRDGAPEFRVLGFEVVSDDAK